MLIVENLHVMYDDDLVLNNVSFRLPSGTIIGLIGPNGAGKSTLIKAMLGLITNEAQAIILQNQPLKAHLKRTSYVPQRANINWHFPISVLDVVLMGVYPKTGLVKKISKQDKLNALEKLKKVNMYEYRNRQIGKLSGGQQQRVFLARTLLQDANLILLDEPFIGIDPATEQLMVDLLKQERDRGKTIVIVNHDLTKVKAYFDDVIILNKEVIAYGKVADVFNRENLTKAYHVVFEGRGEQSENA